MAGGEQLLYFESPPIEDYKRFASSSPKTFTSASPILPKSKTRNRDKESVDASKRRCVSTACIACRRRKSKCDGNIPSCAACSSVYGTECIYDPNSDHRRKGVYKKDIDNLKTRNSTLQTLIQGILNYSEEEVLDLVKQIRSCESLDDVAEAILAREKAQSDETLELSSPGTENGKLHDIPRFESELSGHMGELKLEDGSVKFIGGTSNLLFVGSDLDQHDSGLPNTGLDCYPQQAAPITSWTEVTSNIDLVAHLITMYFTWHYTYFTTLSKSLFYRDFLLGKPQPGTTRLYEYCTPLLVNAMLALGCHFTSWPIARADPHDSATAGDHFFKEAKRLIMENDEHENPKLTTVQALALMSVREAGCGREAKGWVYSGMSFRMACDLGLNVDSASKKLDEQEIDARRITIWGCFLFDKCWSNYLGRQPQVPLSSISVPKFDVFPTEDAEIWSDYTDSGINETNSQPSRTRAVALQISYLCEISGDLLTYFYHPMQLEKPVGKQAELKKLSDLHTRLEAWRKNLPKEMEAKEGQLPSVLVMHMFFHLLFIHLFRPFLKYNQATSPLPAHVSPRKICTQAAAAISKLLRLYKKTHGLRQICNIAVYIAHLACTIHLLNLPDKSARRDIVHGVKQLEEIAESWLCARRTLGILRVLALRWGIDLPEEAAMILTRAETKFGTGLHDLQLLKSEETSPSQVQSIHQVPSSFTNRHVAPTVLTNSALNGAAAAAAAMASAASTPESARIGSDYSMPPQSAAELGQLSRQQRFVLPKAQQDRWNQHRAARGEPAHDQASPSILFGGVDALMEESRDWWLKDQSALAMGFDNWNLQEQDLAMQLNNGSNGIGYLGNNANGYEYTANDTFR